MSNSFITLNRKIISWEWYTDPNTMRFFIHCLLKANWRENKWMGKDIQRGSFITSQQNLASDLKLTRKQILLCIKKLKSTEEIITKGYNKYTLVTVVKYDDYQKIGVEEDEQRYNEGTTKGQQKNTTNNNNNSNNNIIIRGYEENFKIAKSNDKYVKAIISNLNISEEQLTVAYIEFNKHLQRTQDTAKTQADYVTHFRNWYIKKYRLNVKTGKTKSLFNNTL